MLAQFINSNSIIFPSLYDYAEDGTTLLFPELWKEYIESPMPNDGSTYEASYIDTPSGIFQIWNIVQTTVIDPLPPPPPPPKPEPIGRVGKLNGDIIVFPSYSEKTKEGWEVTNYNLLPNSKKIADGWLLIIDAEYPSDGKMYKETGVLVDDEEYGKKIQVVWEEMEPLPELAFEISKKKLLDKIIGLGKFNEFQAILAANEILHEYWVVSVTLTSDDMMVKNMIPVFAQTFNMSEFDILAILKESRYDG